MKDVQKIAEAFSDCGVLKETAREIMHELLDNCDIYADNQDAIDDMLQSKLSIDSYIALRNYFIVG